MGYWEYWELGVSFQNAGGEDRGDQRDQSTDDDGFHSVSASELIGGREG